MKCFPCFKPEKKMPSRRVERGEVLPANAAVSTRSGAPLEKSGKNRRGCSCHSLQSRTSHHPRHQNTRNHHELVDPLLRGEYPEKDLSQAVGVAAMCLQEEDTVRPYMSDAVVALGFLAEVPAGCEEKPSIVLQKKQVEDPSLTNSTKQDESTFDRQRVVAEAIEWGAMRQKQKAQNQGKATDSQCIIAPTEANRV